MRRKAIAKEGTGLSRPQTVRKPRSVPADTRRITPTATPANSKTSMPSQSQQTTPSKRPRESTSAMTNKHVLPKLRIPKPGEGVEPSEIQKILNNFNTKCLHCFFIGREFKFDVNIAQCHLVPPKKCVRAKEDAYVDWLITQMVSD